MINCWNTRVKIMLLRMLCAATLMALGAAGCGAPRQETSHHMLPDSAVSAHPSDTDIASLQRAEAGGLGRPALVWFHADWCEICQALKKQGTLTTLQKQYDGRVSIIMVNIDAPEAHPYLGKYRVRGTPTFVLIDKAGQVVQSFAGWPGAQVVTRAFDQLIAPS